MIGLKVAEFSEIPSGMIGKTVSPATYHIIETNEAAPVDELSVQAWSQVSDMPSLEKKRQFDTDFEIYDITSDQKKFELYIGTAGWSDAFLTCFNFKTGPYNLWNRRHNLFVKLPSSSYC